ncbi:MULTISPECIES: hypothetical protein [unclassified Paenibacillus]|uniref:hypothetical protein n=1 Tax=unclassified Paenibacillus TaxID=185978 RepID=UPI002406F2F5|nr:MULTISPECIES: hypothetical protein [unclassified Paenibacillus]MDF9845179.1 septation ring formation regulator EzrA [Paenibacillus sp. PastF-2]MDF9850329.1 septation ring formation regulator EzrA [Paenibacillus sp. PastM-2]MDF9856968.1 septation ring formation regulator EzrA [Paenibacillus sp. PastF-1]MDH6482175.1 septation ring formation regulator EzrA [Paenibacillus sp. PastH-2]MDH6509661.1 septation ring formation regulator EzrA [Paenibacillus sp. PastM-3]
MLIAVKGNTQLKIDDSERDSYLKLGYDIAEQEGNKLEVVENAPSKTVSWTEYDALVKENAELLKQVAASGSGTPEALNGMKVQLADAEKEIESLKAQLADAKKTAKAEK